MVEPHWGEKDRRANVHPGLGRNLNLDPPLISNFFAPSHVGVVLNRNN